jgi:hypothetical protein
MIRDIRDRITEFMVGSKSIQYTYDDLDYDKRREYEVQLDWSDWDGNKEDDWQYESRKCCELWIDDNFEIQPIALTIEQINQYNPPPNPAKISDPRSGKFIAELGKTSWEVDALKPEVLHQLLEDEITNLIDIDLYNQRCELEDNEKDILINFKDSLPDRDEEGINP